MLLFIAIQRFSLPAFVMSLFLAGASSVDVVADEGSPIAAQQYVQISVVGKVDAAAGTVTSVGKPGYVDARFAVDFSRSPHLRDEFVRLNGRTVQLRGSYIRCTENAVARTPRCDPKRSTTGLFLQPVSVKEFRKANGNVSGKDHAVTCVCRGRLSTGILALGGETTGYIVDVTNAGSVTWELDLDKRERSRADLLDGRAVVVSGDLVVKKGVAVADRWIVRVRTLVTN